MTVYVALTRSDGQTECWEIYTEGRFPSQPKTGGWMRDGSRYGWWREATDKDIEDDIARHAARFANEGVTVVSWRRITAAERVAFAADRPGAGSVYRNAIVDRGDKIEHDIVRARECHRKQLRRARSAELQRLDAEWMRAAGQKKNAEEDRVEAERQKWRDAPADPRIEAATSVEELKQLKVV